MIGTSPHTDTGTQTTYISGEADKGKAHNYTIWNSYIRLNWELLHLTLNGFNEIILFQSSYERTHLWEEN